MTMRRKRSIAVVALLLVAGLTSHPALAGVDSILGKWLVKAESHNGPIDIEFDLKQQGTEIVGTAVVFQGTAPLSSITFDDPQLTIGLNVGGRDFKLVGILKESKISGTWEEIGGEAKGTWVAQRGAAPSDQATLTAAGVLSGTWQGYSSTPNGQLDWTLNLKHDGDAVSGTIENDMGSLTIQSPSYKGSKLQFDLDLGGTMYRMQATLDGDKLTGTWAPAAGGEGGAWVASRRAAAPSPAPTPTPTPAASAAPGTIDGLWDSIALTPDGELPFSLELKQSSTSIAGKILAGDISVPIANASFAGNKLTFEVEYAGGMYRIEATLNGDKLTGKWSPVGGPDGGAWSAERHKP
jgi:hypothetical protein